MWVGEGHTVAHCCASGGGPAWPRPLAVRRTCVHHLNGAAGQTERHWPENLCFYWGGRGGGGEGGNAAAAAVAASTQRPDSPDAALACPVYLHGIHNKSRWQGSDQSQCRHRPWRPPWQQQGLAAACGVAPTVSTALYRCASSRQAAWGVCGRPSALASGAQGLRTLSCAGTSDLWRCPGCCSGKLATASNPAALLTDIPPSLRPPWRPAPHTHQLVHPADHILRLRRHGRRHSYAGRVGATGVGVKVGWLRPAIPPVSACGAALSSDHAEAGDGWL